MNLVEFHKTLKIHHNWNASPRATTNLVEPPGLLAAIPPNKFICDIIWLREVSIHGVHLATNNNQALSIHLWGRGFRSSSLRRVSPGSSLAC
jgi:hypothetical protein